MSECFVYIIAHVESGGAVGPVKVGVGGKPRARLATLQIGNPKPLCLFQTFRVPNHEIALALESAFHEVQSDKCIRGEWFNITPQQATGMMIVNFHIALAAMSEFTTDEITEIFDLSIKDGGVIG